MVLLPVRVYGVCVCLFAYNPYSHRYLIHFSIIQFAKSVNHERKKTIPHFLQTFIIILLMKCASEQNFGPVPVSPCFTMCWQCPLYCAHIVLEHITHNWRTWIFIYCYNCELFAFFLLLLERACYFGSVSYAIRCDATGRLCYEPILIL